MASRFSNVRVNEKVLPTISSSTCNPLRAGVKSRRGRSGGALPLGLFLLSCLVAVPGLKWAFREPPKDTRSGKLKFAPAADMKTGGQENSNAQASSNAQTSSNAQAAAIDVEQLKIRAWHTVPELDAELAQFETVFWEPDDTSSLREWLRKWPHLQNAYVLEIGTGTGLIALTCLKAGAGRVVATDINPNAFANASYNAQHLQIASGLETRLVAAESPAPFSVVPRDERFDLIISNPPWEDAPVGELAAHALYDPQFALLDGLLAESQLHLRPGGKLLLAYGAKSAIERLLDSASERGWDVEIADARELSSLPEVFLPGMLLVLSPRQ